MKVLVACEFSGIVRDAFIAKGHEAMSCDILPTEVDGPHYQGDVLDILNDGWDMMIAHPPCTYLTVTANRSFVNNPERWQQRVNAMIFVHRLMNAPIEKICIENPVGVIGTYIRKADQYIQPYEFGYPEPKKTGLWLKALPLLIPTNIVEPEYITCSKGRRYSPTHFKTCSTKNPVVARLRAKTYQGWADAMAEQWGGVDRIRRRRIAENSKV